MTPREQIALFLFIMLSTGLLVLWALDVLAEKVEAFKSREQVWREIEMRSSRERHPSSKAPLFDQDAR
jgi:hypothetical protein